jgi:hypothetical protein
LCSTDQASLKNFLELRRLYSVINIIDIAPPDRLIRGVFLRDYKHMDNPPLRPYLIDNFIDNSPFNDANPTNASNTIDANDHILIDLVLPNAKAVNGLNAANAVINS